MQLSMEYFFHSMRREMFIFISISYNYLKIKLLYCIFQTGTCALFFAAQGGFTEIVKELLNHGAPVDLPSYVRT